VRKLRHHVLESVAAHAASALAGMPPDLVEPGEVSASDEAQVRLHESFPVWLMTGDDLEKLRSDRQAASPDLRNYMHKTSLWLHLLYRGGLPFGYVHGRHQPKGKHKVTNVSVTVEAALIDQAINEMDQASPGEAAHAGIFECPKVSLAGVIAFPARRKDGPMICVFRDPSAREGWSPSAPISGSALIEKLLQLQVITGPMIDGPLNSSAKPLGRLPGIPLPRDG
jgi:hypothetical protein